MYCSTCGTALPLATRFCPGCGSPAAQAPAYAVAAPAAPESAPPFSAVVGWLLLAAGGLFALGSLLPWMKASTPFGTMERGALDGDGVITLVAGIAIIACGVAALARVGKQAAYWIGLLAATVGGAVAAYDGTRFVRLMRAVNDDSDGVMSAEIGIGLVLVGIAVLPALAGLCVLASRFVTPYVQDGRLVRPQINGTLQVVAVLVLVAAVGLSTAAASQEQVELAASDSLDDDRERDDDELTSSLSGPLEEQSSGSGTPASEAPDAEFGTDADFHVEDTSPSAEDELYGTNGPSKLPSAVVVEEPAEQVVEPEAEPVVDPVEPAHEVEPEAALAGPGQISADPYLGPSGAVITLTGSGWTPGSEVSITYSDPATGTTTNHGTAQVDADGEFTSTFTADDEGSASGGRVITASSEGAEATTEYYVE